MHTAQNGTIPSYSLFINPRDLQKLRKDIWDDEHVPAKLELDKNFYKIQIAYRGALTREFPKKSYHINFIKPGIFFGGREIHLNAEYLDPSLLRNKLSLDFFHRIGTLSPESRYVLLKINGSICGIYLQLESVDDLFIKKRGLPKGAIFYARNDDANFSFLSPDTGDCKKSLKSGYKRKCGRKADDGYLCELIYKINTISRADFGREIVNVVAIDKYLRWLAGVVCTQNYDGFIQNYALYRSCVTGLFELIPWDYDGSWGRDCHGKVMEYDYVPIKGYNTLSARILDVPDFRVRYRKVLEEILETQFTVESLESQITDLHKLLRPYILYDPFKRNDVAEFDSEPEHILQFITNRRNYLREHLTELEG